jgi:hypothetical protein
VLDRRWRRCELNRWLGGHRPGIAYQTTPFTDRLVTGQTGFPLGAPSGPAATEHAPSGAL